MTDARTSGATRTIVSATGGRAIGVLVLAYGLILWALVCAGTASAAPTATLKVKVLPIPGFHGTGNILGAGSEVGMQVTISGSEYGGFPSPLTGIDVYTPAGVRIDPAGFATCAPSVLEAKGPAGCPKRSNAGPPGVGFGVVAFGGEQVPEQVSIRDFFTPTGNLTFYVEGNSPTSFQILEKSHWVAAAAPFGQELIVEVPLIETVPGADDASVTSFDVKVGAAFRRHGKIVSYITRLSHFWSPEMPYGGRRSGWAAAAGLGA